MSQIQVTRAGARETIRKLIGYHRGILKDIEDGKKFYRNGEDFTSDLHKYVLREIEQCRMVDDALDNMNRGEIKRAAAMLEQIKEFLPK